MTAKKQTNYVISPLQAFVFAVVLSLGLILVLAPVLPGDAPLDAGDIAYKTFQANGQVITEKGEAVSEADLTEIRAEGLLGNEMTFGGVFAAVIAGILGGGALASTCTSFSRR